MNDYYEEDQYHADWEREHQHRLIWSCPQCEYSYESERCVNEALNCPHCKCQTVNSGESYRG